MIFILLTRRVFSAAERILIMKLPLIDYRQFRLSRLNTPQFRHLKLLLFWPIFSLVFCYLENYRPTVYYAPMRCALDHWIPFCKWFVIPYAF